MTDAVVAEAARTLSRSRWGDMRVRSLVAELVTRRDELSDEQRAELRRVAETEETR
jgi:transposase